jgi:photosystem II stability/assembly factor-like uncharacterized protein
VAVANKGGIYTSTNPGAAWAKTSAPTNGWISVASSADGTKLVAGRSGPEYGVYLSTDSGATWTKTSSSESARAVASSADGSKLVAANWMIRTAQTTIQVTTTPGTAGYLTGAQNSAIELQYIGDGQFLPISYVGTISAY